MQAKTSKSATKGKAMTRTIEAKPIERLLASLSRIEGDIAKVLMLVAPRNKRGYEETAADITVSKVLYYV